MCNSEIHTLRRNTAATLRCPTARYRNIGLTLESSSPALSCINIPLSNFRCATLISVACLCCLPHKSSSFCVWAFNLGAELRQYVFEAVEEKRLGTRCLGERGE
jgi:hypothetical protein